MNKNWFNEARFGMFIHWGAYSVAGRGEWVLNREHIPYDEYTEKYVNNFTAEKYNPDEWVSLAKTAGMKYMILTTRHHDGFCLWDTKTTDFNSVKMGPKKDLVREFAEAVRRGGVKLGFYYSVADWSHIDYPGAYERDWPEEWKNEKQRKSFVSYYQSQLKELMTQYGQVDILWYDGCIPGPLDGREANTMVKQLQPNILINERNGEPFDFFCSEQAVKNRGRNNELWEACFTLNDNWGYHKGDFNYKTSQQVVILLLDAAAGGGNLLINIGPREDGTIPEKSVSILQDVGKWMHKNRDAVTNNSVSPFGWNNFGKLTTKDNIVYVHIYKSTGNELCISEIKNRVLKAYYLENNKAIKFEQNAERLTLKGLPDHLRDTAAAVIVLELDGEPKPIRGIKNFWVPG